MIIENKNLYDEHLKKLVISSYIKNQPYSLLSYLNHKILESYVDFIVESSEEFIFTKYSGNILLGVCFLSTNVNSIFVRFLFYLVKTKKIKYLFKKNIFLTIRKLFNTFILYRSEFLKILPKTEVVSIFVEKKYRNKKIATTLLNKVEIFLKKKKIEAYFVKTFKTKKIALRFYKMNDFIILNKNKPLNNKVYILLKQL